MVKVFATISFNVNDDLYAYIKERADQLELSQTALMSYMVDRVMEYLERFEINDYKRFKLDVARQNMDFVTSGKHSLYLSVKQNVYDDLVAFLSTSPKRESISSGLRVFLTQYIILEDERVIMDDSTPCRH